MRKKLVILFFVVSIFVPTFMMGVVDCDAELDSCLASSTDESLCWYKYKQCLKNSYAN